MPKPTNPHKVEELISYFNTAFGMNAWPKQFIVSPLLYANVCQATFKYLVDKGAVIEHEGIDVISIAIGPNGGIMFKNVELIMR